MAEISYKCLFLHIQLHQNDSAIIVFCTVDFIALSFHYTVHSVYYNSLMEIQFVQFVPILYGKKWLKLALMEQLMRKLKRSIYIPKGELQ